MKTHLIKSKRRQKDLIRIILTLINGKMSLKQYRDKQRMKKVVEKGIEERTFKMTYPECKEIFGCKEDCKPCPFVKK